MTRRGFLRIFGSIAAVAVATVTLDLPLQSPSTPVKPGWATGTLRRGDVFTIEGRYSVHPLTYQSTGRLQQFVVTADVSGDEQVISPDVVWPKMVATGPYQTVTGVGARWWQVTPIPRHLIQPLWVGYEVQANID